MRERRAGSLSELTPIRRTPRRMNGITEVENLTAGGVADACDHAVLLHRAREQGEGVAAERVDGPLPERGLQRLVAAAEGRRVDNFRGAEPLQVVGSASLRVAATTSKPRCASRSIAMLATPPVAPLTRTFPRDGASPSVRTGRSPGLPYSRRRRS